MPGAIAGAAEYGTAEVEIMQTSGTASQAASDRGHVVASLRRKLSGY